MSPPVDSATHCERDDAAENCGIEITPEMIEVGVSAFLDGDLRFENEASIVLTIFKEMIVRSPYWQSNPDSFRGASVAKK